MIQYMDIIVYQPFVNEIKGLIQKKQFQAIKLVNTETINLYWETLLGNRRRNISSAKRKRMGKIYCTDISEGTAKRVSRSAGIFSGKFVENA